MKAVTKLLSTLCMVLLLSGCEKYDRELTIAFSYDDDYDRESISTPYLKVENNDSVFYEKWMPIINSVKITGLKKGIYDVTYYTVLGEKRVEKVTYSMSILSMLCLNLILFQ